MQIQSNLGKNTKINKQSHVKFWFNRKKYGAVSYLLSCISNKFPYCYCWSQNNKTFIFCSDSSVSSTQSGWEVIMECYNNRGRFLIEAILWWLIIALPINLASIFFSIQAPAYIHTDHINNGKVLSLLKACFDLISSPSLPWKFKSWTGKLLKIWDSIPRSGRSKKFFGLFLFIFKFSIKNCISLSLTIF